MINSDNVTETPVKGFNLVELKGAGCGWFALVRADKGNESRCFIGTAKEVKNYLGDEWNVRAI